MQNAFLNMHFHLFLIKTFPSQGQNVHEIPIRSFLMEIAIGGDICILTFCMLDKLKKRKGNLLVGKNEYKS